MSWKIEVKKPPFFQSFVLDFSGITFEFSVSICDFFCFASIFFFSTAPPSFPKNGAVKLPAEKKARLLRPTWVLASYPTSPSRRGGWKKWPNDVAQISWMKSQVGRTVQWVRITGSPPPCCKPWKTRWWFQKMELFHPTYIWFWVVATQIFLYVFIPTTWGNDAISTSIFFRWVLVETTNYRKKQIIWKGSHKQTDP